jgi:hypothetical protein
MKQAVLPLLEKFVSGFEGSVYWEHAVLQLGGVYALKSDDKAKVEYEKLKDSDNKYISDTATTELKEIERRLVDKKSKEQKPPSR